MQAGDILFVRTRGIIGALIRWVTRSEVSHVALALDDKRILEIQPEFGSVIVENPYKEYILGRYRFGLSSGQQQIIRGVAEEISGRPYDWSIIKALFFRLVGLSHLYRKEDPASFICTEAIDYVYLCAGINLVERLGPDITPEDLLRSPDLAFQTIKEEGEPRV